MRPIDRRYFDSIDADLESALSVARAARALGKDPATEVEIPVAEDMADRVENILGIPGVAARVRELEGEMSREEAALALAADFAAGRVGEYDTPEGKIEGAVRTAVALLTEGVVAAPIEGIDRVEVVANDDGTQFVRVFYAGPIRSAGGTAQALSVLVADYTRSLLDIDRYKPRDIEVERYAEEVALYDGETGLQYSPKDAETKFIAEHCPIMLDGEATGEEEVEGFRDLERVDTNNPRGGMCLVLAEGIALKTSKIKRYTSDLPEVDWPWLEDLIDGTYAEGVTGDADTDGGSAGEPGDDESADDTESTDAASVDVRGGPPRSEPHEKYLRDLIAGRPVFGHPSEAGGFRLRYGRARNHGHATAGVHPAAMRLLEDFLAAGTQIKTERPGKAAGVVPVDSIEGPTVKLANGDVRRIDDPAEALEVRNGVEEIIDLGEYLVNYGEFVENNRPLAPASYTVEWWVQDLERAGADVQALRDDPGIDLADPTPSEALTWAEEFEAPLHPAYTYLWHDLPVEGFETLADAVETGRLAEADGARKRSVAGVTADTGDATLVLPHTDGVREALETLLVEHRQGEETITVPDALVLVRSLGFTADLERTWETLPSDARAYADGENAIEAVRAVACFDVRERAPTRVGCRMGRPEKSEERELSPAVHTLFPIGEAGGNQRDVTAAAGHTDNMGDRPGRVETQVVRRQCGDCGEETYRTTCPACGAHTEAEYRCPDCDIGATPDESGRVECPRCGEDATAVRSTTVDVHGAYRDALGSVGERESAFEILKGVKGLSSAEKTPEPIGKGILRAKHDVSAFKDGTVRYDMTDLPVTSVRPAEVDLTADRFRELGYEEDINGDPLRYDDQLVPLRVQDVILSDGAAEHMLRVADFVDDLLTQFYGLEPFYEVEERDDLVGELVFGMAPHTSAAVVARVVGFTSAAVGYAHPYFHAAKRRNCFHPETKLWYRDEDGEWIHGAIEAFVEDRLDDPREDDFGTLTEELDGDVVVPSVDGDGEMNEKPVTAVSKHPAPDHLIRIQTRSGREIRVTPDHSIHVFEDGRLVSKRASEVSESDHVAKPRRLDPVDPGDGHREIDLLAEFIRTDSVPDDRLMMKGLDTERLYDRFESVLAEEWPGRFYPLKSTAEHLGVSHKTLSNYLYRESVPVSVLGEFFDSTDDLLSFVPNDVTLGMKRDRTEIDRFVEINERVATLLGYYAAEGFAREQETPKGTVHQTTICGTEEECRDFFERALREEFGVEPYRENHAKVTVSGRLPRVFLDTVLDAGVLAHEKRVPQPIFDASSDVVAAYLGGYFSGDGTAKSNALSVDATTISRELKEDVLALLTRLDIAGRVEINDPVPLREKFPDYYEIDDPSSSETRYVIRITSEDAERFADVVGFHLPRKDERLTERRSETNVRGRRAFDGGGEDVLVEEIDTVEYVSSDTEYTYCLTVADTHSLIANDTSQKQCDGDEDCVMLLMDGLLNFSKKYLPDQRGGSVAEDARLVTVDPDDNVRFTSFGEFWEELDATVERDGKFRKKTCAAEGWETYAFDESHEASLRPIEKAIRYRASEEEGLIRVETQFGRSIEITEHHSLFRYDDGIEEVAGGDLDEGDLILAPRELHVEPEATTIDVTDCIEEPHVVIDDDVEDVLTAAWEATGQGSVVHETFDRGLSYRLPRRKMAYRQFQRLLDRSTVPAVPTDVRVGLSGSSDGIRKEIDVDREFGWLLGMFAAEGTLSSTVPAIHNADEDVIDEVTAAIERTLGHEPDVQRSNNAYEVRFPAVFREVLYNLGFEDADNYDSSKKVVPDCIRTAPRKVVIAFLEGFIVGNGSRSSNDNHTTIAFHTTSEDVKDGVVFLLHRLGIVASVSTREREETRQRIYDITVSGGVFDNSLARVLNGEEPDHPKSLVVRIPDALMKLREMDIEGIKRIVPKYLKRRENVSLETLHEMVSAIEDQSLPEGAREPLATLQEIVDGDLSYLRVKDIERVDYDGFLYDLQVGGDPVFTANWLYAHNSMDAPLVMSSRIDPTEIDDEAHNVDIVSEYPRSFYESTREMADPGEVDIETAEDTLGTDRAYAGFQHTHDTADLALGPDLSAYKTLGSMEEKMDAQLDLARRIRAVDESDVAERIIEYHFLPDLLGNLRAFSRQETRCLDCGEKYRRPPLSGTCRECGGDVNLTVHEGSVDKYMGTATRIAEEFDAREYTKQRLEVLERSLERIFENDHNKSTTLADYM
jgi:DNA polymerase II large subunit